MANEITQSQYDTAKQTLRNTRIKLNILNYQYYTLNSIEGNVISGNIQVDASYDIRRTCSLSFVVTDSSFNIQAGGQIFLDKLIQIYVGVEDMFTNKTAWTNMGVYLINQPSYSYDAKTHTLSFDGVDLMAKLTGLRNGYIAGLGQEDITLIETGQNIREVIIGILQTNGFTRYVVEECRLATGVIQDVPYDLEFGQGSTWYDVLSKLRNILPKYQIYFDVDGVFHYDMIPSSASDPIMIDEDLWQDNVLSEKVEVDFEGVKNVVEVYGVMHDTQYFSDASVTTIDGTDIALTVDESYQQIEYIEVAFVLPSQAAGQITINVNDQGAMPLVDAYGNPVTSLADNEYWVISMQTDNTWLFMGHLQAQATYEDNNPDSPFYVGSSVGRIVLPLYGGEYENIQSDDLALERAKYEIYVNCRMNDTVQLTTVPIYWADVNWKVNYASLGKTEVKQYMIKSIHTDLAYNGQQTWELISFYPLYPVIE